MKTKPSLDEFRNGGGDTGIDQISQNKFKNINSEVSPLRIERITKTIRIRKIFEHKLKEEVYRRIVSEGQRITESDIIDQALQQYWKLNL